MSTVEHRGSTYAPSELPALVESLAAENARLRLSRERWRMVAKGDVADLAQSYRQRGHLATARMLDAMA